MERDIEMCCEKDPLRHGRIVGGKCLQSRTQAASKRWKKPENRFTLRVPKMALRFVEYVGFRSQITEQREK